MRAARGRLALVVVGAAAAVAGLRAAGTGPLATPPVAPWRSLDAWYADVGAPAAAVTGLRLVTLVAAGWVLCAAALQLLASLAPRTELRRLADAVSPLVLRRLARGAAGLSITVGLAGPPAPADPAGTAVMEALDAAATTTTSTTEATPSTSTSAPASTSPTTVPSVPTTTARPPAAPAAAAEEVVVAPGDCFWSLAADAVAEGGSRVAVEGYWRRLVAANRSRLVDPANADLLYPGQVLVLPPLDA